MWQISDMWRILDFLLYMYDNTPKYAHVTCCFETIGHFTTAMAIEKQPNKFDGHFKT